MQPTAASPPTTTASQQEHHQPPAQPTPHLESVSAKQQLQQNTCQSSNRGPFQDHPNLPKTINELLLKKPTL